MRNFSVFKKKCKRKHKRIFIKRSLNFKNNSDQEIFENCFTYEIFFPDIKIYYIGMSLNVDRRISFHKCSHNVVGYYLKKYRYEMTVRKFHSKLWAAACEIELIDLYKKSGLRLLNKTAGGDYPWKTDYEINEVRKMLCDRNEAVTTIRTYDEWVKISAAAEFLRYYE